jgi:uncharacterized repeat protein (TIGR03803 family)
MKTSPFRPLLLTLLLASSTVMLAGRAPAQTFTNLHSFAGYPSDGDYPVAGLLLSGNTLYGTTGNGGSNQNYYSQGGTVFRVNTDGSGFTILNSFGDPPDGSFPRAGLTLAGNTLYGTCSQGGTNGRGTVFAVNTDGTGYGTLHSFNPSADGSASFGILLLSGTSLYGTTSGDGLYSGGSVFAINTDGRNFTVLHFFTNAEYGGTDGVLPRGDLILSGNTLYGTCSDGGTYNGGTVFAINTDGTDYRIVFNLGVGVGTPGAGVPLSGLILSGNTLYGTASRGAPVFSVHTDGSGFTNLYGAVAYPSFAGLVLSGKTLYGTTFYGGVGVNNGTVFAINTDGTGFTNLYNFTGAGPYGSNIDGYYPEAGLVLSGNTVYGTASQGGTNIPNGNPLNNIGGTVFKLTVPITLFFQNIGSTTVLSWNDPSFILQAASAVTGSYTNIPGATSPYTNTITGPQQFFRLLVSQ